jgi:hypothetical protein
MREVKSIKLLITPERVSLTQPSKAARVMQLNRLTIALIATTGALM